MTLNMVVLLTEAATLKVRAALRLPTNTGLRRTTLVLVDAGGRELLAERLQAPTTLSELATTAEAIVALVTEKESCLI